MLSPDCTGLFYVLIRKRSIKGPLYGWIYVCYLKSGNGITNLSIVNGFSGNIQGRGQAIRLIGRQRKQE